MNGILFLIIGCILGIIIGFLYFRFSYEKRVEEAGKSAEKIIEEAKREAKQIKDSAEVKAKDHWYKERRKFEKETASLRNEIERKKRDMEEQETQLQRRVESNSRREKELKSFEKQLMERDRALKAKEKRIEEIIDAETRKLEEVARLTREEAKAELMKSLEAQARHEAAQLMYKIREEAKENAEREAKKIIAMAIQRCAAPHTAETTVSVVPLPSEDLKGRIIGREGRNIRAFESATGVEVIIDDTPEAVTLSSFDPVRREIAKMTMERLIQDGRIHPARIEEIAEKTREEFEEIVKGIGEEVTLDLGVSGMHPDLLKLVGKMKFRTSYGQNLLLHSIEVARLCSIMAGELELNIEFAKRAGLLHDIGKILDEGQEGPHAVIGAKVAKRLGENDLVVNAIASHHAEEKAISPLASLVAASDAVSGARPGARRESLEAYIKRIEKLEEIAVSFQGVEKAFALQAGREIRIIVEATNISDIQSFEVAREIANKIEEELEYPGQIKVVVIRETRAVEYAK